MTETIYGTDAYAFEVAATVVDVDPDTSRVLLDRTVFYPGGGGQPADRGVLLVGDDPDGAVDAGDRLEVVGVGQDRRGVWHEVTGGLPVVGQRVHGRLDFELPDWDPEDRDPLEARLREELAAARPVEVAFLPREEADRDPSLIRTKVSLLPDDHTVVRVIDIVGLDRQADGGTHVRSTTEVGDVRIAKVESKGRGFRRIRLALDPVTP